MGTGEGVKSTINKTMKRGNSCNKDRAERLAAILFFFFSLARSVCSFGCSRVK